MPGEPYFPKPSPRSVYREPQPVVPDASAPTTKKPVVIRRPKDHLDMQPPRAVVGSTSHRAPTYWERHELLIRYPRSFGALCFALGGGITWSTIDSLLHGGVYGRLTTAFAPVLMFSGAWIVVRGYPIDPEDGLPPRGWTFGYFTVALVGLLLGVGLAVALASTG